MLCEKQLEQEFEQAIRNRDFKVYLQPQVGLGKDAGYRAEALVRWEHPQKGLILPGDFIPLLEKNGGICELDMYMLREVCRLLSEWRERGMEPIKVSVNISRAHLKSEGEEIYKKYAEIKESWRIPDGILGIEITETELLERNHLDFIKKVLEGFRSCGFRMALDDFGFAYSSLVLLKAFEVDTLKLDREFFVDENEKSRKIVEGMIELAHKLGMTVVAEGIEEMEQVEALRKMGCDFVQGYVFSKPLSVREFEIWRERQENQG